MNIRRTISWIAVAVGAGFATRRGENRLVDMMDEHDRADRARNRLRLRFDIAAKAQKDFHRRIDMLLPVIASRLSGNDGSMTMIAETMIGQFLASLREEQLSAILGALDTEQAGLAAEIYKLYGQKWRKDHGGGDEPEEPEATPEEHADAPAADARPSEGGSA